MSTGKLIGDFTRMAVAKGMQNLAFKVAGLQPGQSPRNQFRSQPRDDAIGYSIAPPATRQVWTCLLYTSPSPRDS